MTKQQLKKLFISMFVILLVLQIFTLCIENAKANNPDGTMTPAEMQEALNRIIEKYSTGPKAPSTGSGAKVDNTPSYYGQCDTRDVKDKDQKITEDWNCIDFGSEYASKIKPISKNTVSGTITFKDKYYQCIKGYCSIDKPDACCKEVTADGKAPDAPTPEVPKDCTAPTDGTDGKKVVAGECIEKCKKDYIEDKGTDNQGSLECKEKNQICCRPVKCEGVIATDWEDQKARCKDGAALLPTPGLPEGQVCCKAKEPAREVPKKPGTWGRLGICFGIGGESVWDSETKWLGKAKTTLDGVTGSEFTADRDALKTKLTEIETEKNPSNKLDLIKAYNKDASALKQKIADSGQGITDKTKLDDLAEQQQAVESSQDSVDKVKKGFAITKLECILNYASIAMGIAKSGMLVFGSGEREMGSCNPETALRGTKLCTTCNEDPLRLCTKERCEILGNCIAVSQSDGKQYACIPGKCEELGNPVFKKGTVELLAKGTSLPSSNKADSTADEIIYTQPLTILNGKIKTDMNSGKAIPFNTRIITINLTTDQPAKCRYILDKKNSSFSEMSDFEDNDFPTYLGQASYQFAYVSLPGEISRDTTHVIYVKCQNACGIEPKADYDQNTIVFKLDKKPDELPPEIVFIDPAVGSILSSDLDFVNASFWIDELGTCKFSDASINFTIDYNGSKSMVPFNQLSPGENSSVVAGMCSPGKCLDRNAQCARCWLKLDLSKGFELINMSSEEFNETRFYHLMIRCNDVPGNIMTEDSVLDYSFMTAPGYQINITMPEDGQKSYETMPLIEVTSFERTTQCKYKIYNQSMPSDPPAWKDMYFIDEAFAKVHNGQHNVSLEGSLTGKVYVLAALCRDQYGLEARDSVTFIVLKDTIAPILIRTYHDTISGDYLAIETDEKSSCAYSFSGCNFNYSEGIEMAGTEQYLHAAYWKDKTYFVKCYDKWGNFPTETGQGTNNTAYNWCTAILKPFEIPLIR